MLINNKEGSSTLSAVLSLFLVGVLAAVFVNSYGLYRGETSKAEDFFLINQTINNKLENVQISNWDYLEDEEITLRTRGKEQVMDVIYGSKEVTEYNTESIDVTFKIKDKTKGTPFQDSNFTLEKARVEN